MIRRQGHPNGTAHHRRKAVRKAGRNERRTRRKRVRRTAPGKPVTFAIVALFLVGDPFLWIASMEAILSIGYRSYSQRLQGVNILTVTGCT